MVLGGLVVIGGAVTVLRAPASEEETPTSTPFPPPQTTVRAFADKRVLVPEAGKPPAPPAELKVRPSKGRLVVSWSAADTGEPEPEGAAGYEVQWGRSGNLDRVRLVAEPVVQLDGLVEGYEYLVQVRTVDSFGQRSEPISVASTAIDYEADRTGYTFADRFDGEPALDPAKWSLTRYPLCGTADGGEGDNAHRLIINARCGSETQLTLRSRTPFRLLPRAQAKNGELGRMVVATDAPGPNSELTIDLVPGAANVVGCLTCTSTTSPQPGRAGLDRTLPPGTIRVRLAGTPARFGRPASTTVQVLTGPGVPTRHRPVRVEQPRPPRIGVSVRWEVVFRVDGILVQRNGVTVGGAHIVPQWTEATALLGMTTDSLAGLHNGLDLVGFTGAPTETPPLVPAPPVNVAELLSPSTPPGSEPRTYAAGRDLAGVRGGRLWLALVPAEPLPKRTGRFTVDVAGRELPLHPAVDGQPMVPGAIYPMVADLPADAVLLDPGADQVSIEVRAEMPADARGGATVAKAELELIGDPSGGFRAPRTEESGIGSPEVRPELARPEVRLLNAAGTPIPENEPVPRGRLVIDIVLNGQAGQVYAGELAGLAGVEVSLDQRKIAGIPTTADGPGVGGSWRLALNTDGLAPGGHTIQVRTVGVSQDITSMFSYSPFILSE